MSNTFNKTTFGKTFLSFALILVSFFSILTIPANAQKIGVKPFNEGGQNRGVFRFIANPGETINDAVVVVNGSDFEGGAEVKPRDTETDSSGNLAFIADQVENKSTGNWIKLAEQKLVVPAQKALKVPFVLTVPPDTKAGEYTAGIVVSPVNVESGEGVGVQVRSGITVYIIVRGDLKIDNQISEFSIINPTQDTFEKELGLRGFIKPSNMVVRFKGVNNGNIYSELATKFIIESGDGSKKEIPLTRILNLNSSFPYYYVNTGLPYLAGTTKIKMEYSSLPYNIKDQEKYSKTTTSDGSLEYSFTLTAADLKAFDDIKAKQAAKRAAELQPNQNAQQDAPGKKNDFVVKEVEAKPEAKSEDKKDNSMALIGGLIGLIVLLIAAFVGYIIYSKRKEKQDEVKTATPAPVVKSTTENKAKSVTTKPKK